MHVRRDPGKRKTAHGAAKHRRQILARFAPSSLPFSLCLPCQWLRPELTYMLTLVPAFIYASQPGLSCWPCCHRLHSLAAAGLLSVTLDSSVHAEAAAAAVVRASRQDRGGSLAVHATR